jgi:hypothetical protein
MKIVDPENKLEEFDKKACPGASIGLDELFERVKGKKEKGRPIKSYFRSKSAFGYNWWYLIGHPWVIISESYYELKYAFQRAIRGWDDKMARSIDATLSKIIPQLIADLKKGNHGVPWSMFPDNIEVGEETPEQFKEASEKWDKILDEIAEGFQYYHDNQYECWTDDEHKILMEKLEKSFNLLQEYFTALWE